VINVTDGIEHRHNQIRNFRHFTLHFVRLSGLS
jgi:hypothetical protein